mmetsp:Transcript_24993/g.54349  ORF Transcript_24993/g.54349 Transcript_24993/m.54349 type:complete len:229 (-) Transcript_24993:980-1666(-)
MGGAVLTQTNGVVGHHVDDTSLRQGAHTHGTAHVVSEDEEGSAVGDQAAAVQGDTVADGAHAVLAHTEAQVALSVLVLLEVTVHLHQGQVGGGQIGRATNQTGQHGGQGIQHGLGVLAGGQGLVLGLEGRQGLLPALGQLAAGQGLELSPLLGVLGGVGSAVGLPLLLLLSTAGDGGAEDVVHVLGHLELSELPLQVLAGGSSLLSAQRGTVHVVGVSLVGGAVANQG